MDDEKQKIKNVIIQAAQKYEEYLNDCYFLIVYQKGNSHMTTQVGFRDMHFKHLTGVDTLLSAQRFYEKCLNKKLSLEDFSLSKDGKRDKNKVFYRIYTSYYIIIV